MKTVNFEALDKMINDHDGSKLTDIDRAYAKGYIEATRFRGVRPVFTLSV